MVVEGVVVVVVVEFEVALTTTIVGVGGDDLMS